MPTWHAADQTRNLGAGKTLTFDAPANLSAGDLIVAIVPLFSAVNNTAAPTATASAPFVVPAGWIGQLEDYTGGSNGGPRCMIFTKIATGAEPVSYTFQYQAGTPGGTNSWFCLCGRVTGALGNTAYRVFQQRHAAFNPGSKSVPTPTGGYTGLIDSDYLHIWVGIADEDFLGTPPAWAVVSPTFDVFETQVYVYPPTTDTASYAIGIHNVSGTSLPSVVPDYQSTLWMQVQIAFIDESAQQSFCPPSAINMGSSDIAETDSGPGFSSPVRPPYESQKNITAVGYDPRTKRVLALSGGEGMFTEDPPTSIKVSHVLDCGTTLVQVADLTDIYMPYDPPLPNPDENTELSAPQTGVIPGKLPEQWLIFNFAGGYWFSNDDGITWSARRESGIGLQFDAVNDWYDTYGINGVFGQFDTRHQGISVDIETGTVGYMFISLEESSALYNRIGIRRGILDDFGNASWENSIEPGRFDSGGTGWEFSLRADPIGAGNGRWIAVVNYENCRSDEGLIPNIRINTTATMEPGSWRAPEWLISQSFCQDIYQGAGPTPSAPSYTATNFGWGEGTSHGRIKFIPQVGHAAGGRWWILGCRNTLLYSDDNGDTWSNSLADHIEDPGAMHPLLNWRNINALGPQLPKGPEPKVLDIISDPFNS